jgi:hypothetical protein
MRLLFFPANNAWAFVFGSDLRTASPIQLHGFPLFFVTKGEAIEAARMRGLALDLRTGLVTNDLP